MNQKQSTLDKEVRDFFGFLGFSVEVREKDTQNLLFFISNDSPSAAGFFCSKFRGAKLSYFNEKKSSLVEVPDPSDLHNVILDYMNENNNLSPLYYKVSINGGEIYIGEVNGVKKELFP